MATKVNKGIVVDSSDVLVYQSSAGPYRQNDSDGLSIQVINQGANPFTAFKVQSKGPSSDVWTDVKVSDFVGTPGDTFPVFATKDPTVLAGGDSAIVLLGGNFYQWRILVSSTDTICDVYAFGDRA